MTGLLAQLEAFFLTLILGILSGMIFHYYQLLIRSIRLRKYSLYIMDFFLWMAMICVISVGILLINQGEVRIYVFIALVLGIIAYFQKIARRTSPLLQKTSKATLAVLRKTFHLLRWPFQRLRKLIKKRPPDDLPPLDNEL